MKRFVVHFEVSGESWDDVDRNLAAAEIASARARADNTLDDVVKEDSGVDEIIITVLNSNVTVEKKP